MKKTILILLLFANIINTYSQEKVGNIVSKSIQYTVDNKTFIGTLAYDKNETTKRPGIIVVHEWQGINDYAKKRAVDLANEGYIAFALDMYGDGKEVPRSQAGSMSKKIGSDFNLIEKRFNAAIDILISNELTDKNNIAAIGYCFGGGVVLNMARLGTDIKGVVGFHSSINTGLTSSLGDIKTKILAFQGDKDPAAPKDKQDEFIKEMTDNKVDFEYIVYENVAAHNFTNPAGNTYYKYEAEKSWETMLTFFDTIFE